MSVKLSPQHGVNPSVEQCFVCMKDVGVVLFGRLRGDVEAPRQVCLGPNSPPCRECQEHMRKGVILVSVDEAKSVDLQNPWRTGGWVVVREAFVKRVFRPSELVETVLRRRMAFMPDETWDLLELPREATS